MFLRRSLAASLAALALAAGLTVAGEARAEEVVTIGTLAPKNSPWGKVFEAWSQAVEKKTDGKLKLKWYYNGAQGDEKAMVAKIRAGQLSGAAVTAVGLSDVYKPILAFQSPDLFTEWAKLDSARNATLADIRAAMAKQGKAGEPKFFLAGSGDVGRARTMSKGKAIKKPDDLKTMKVYRWQDDIIAPVTASVIGYTAVPSSVPGLLPALSSGRINCITVPPLAATQLQWWSHLDHVNESVVGIGIGGLIFNNNLFTDGAPGALPGDLRGVLKSTGEKAGSMLTERIRKEDDKAYDTIKGRMTVVKLSDAEKKVWAEKFKEVRKRLSQGTFDAAWMKKLEQLAGK